MGLQCRLSFNLKILRSPQGGNIKEYMFWGVGTQRVLTYLRLDPVGSLFHIPFNCCTCIAQWLEKPRSPEYDGSNRNLQAPSVRPGRADSVTAPSMTLWEVVRVESSERLIDPLYLITYMNLL